MDSRDEELTLKNVDEQVEQYLSRPQASQPPTKNSLPRVVSNLQSVYEEERRLEHIWARINSKAAALNIDKAITGKLPALLPAHEEKQATHSLDGQSVSSVPYRGNRKVWQVVRGKSGNKWYGLAVGLAAAIIVIALLTWPILSYVFHPTQIAGSPSIVGTATPQSQPTLGALNTKAYVGQYFKLQYPANWVVTSTKTRGTDAYLQTAQFRPSATSSVFVNVNAIARNNYSAQQLLDMDPDVKLGKQLSTNIVTYNGLSWTVGTVELAGSAHAQAGKLEIAYCNQSTSYRIEFGAASNMFSSNMQIFNTIFASFDAQKTEQKTAPTVTPTINTPTVASTTTPVAATPSPIPTPLPTSTNVLGIKVYSSLYFTIQYPANWVVTNVTAGGLYQQTIQFRPSTTSAIFVNVNVMYSSDLASSLLLLIDPDVKLGTLLSTNTVTYNGLPWTVGVVNLLGQAQPSKIEVAYANQNLPYKIEFSAPTDMFSSYTNTFNTMFASFQAVS